MARIGAVGARPNGLRRGVCPAALAGVSGENAPRPSAAPTCRADRLVSLNGHTPAIQTLLECLETRPDAADFERMGGAVSDPVMVTCNPGSAADWWRIASDWPRAAGGTGCTAQWKLEPDDFVVVEELGFEPSGSGSHLLLRVRKTGHNTQWVARRLAALAGCAPRDVGYAGLKDRHARTEQWFSVPDGSRQAEAGVEIEPGIEVLEAHPHHRKLRPGSARGNRFDLRLRGFAGDAETFSRALSRIAETGFPNYFGEQRFGRGYNNLPQAAEMFAGRRVRQPTRGLLLSAARAWIFNEVLAERIRRGAWDRLLPGERVNLAGTRSTFALENEVPADDRLAGGDIHPTGPLWGRAGAGATHEAGAIEHAVAEGWRPLCDGLERAGLSMERRPLRVMAEELCAEREGTQTWRLRFALPAGCYATALLRELLENAGAEALPEAD